MIYRQKLDSLAYICAAESIPVSVAIAWLEVYRTLLLNKIKCLCCKNNRVIVAVV